MIVCGSYDRLLFGFDKDSLRFSFPAHLSAIKCLSCTGKYLATGATDEHIKLYDLSSQKEIGLLSHHSGTIHSVNLQVFDLTNSYEGTINALLFFRNSHLISASDDGTIAIVRTSDWELLKSLKGHIGPISAIAIHPSGKILLSVGHDMTLKTWDLTRGVLALSTKLHAACEKVAWSSTGLHFALMYEKEIQIHDVQSGKISSTFKSKNRINSLKIFVSGKVEICAFAGQDRIIRFIDVKSGNLLFEFPTIHSNRIKDIDILGSSGNFMISSCSSDGTVLVHEIIIEENGSSDFKITDLKLTWNYDTKVRLTCIAMVNAVPKAIKK